MAPIRRMSNVSFMSENLFSVIRTARTAIEADLCVMALRNAGFHPLDLDTAGHFSIGGADIAFKVRVPTEELESARAFLSDLEEAAPEGMPTP
jgi:hypothetical protein